MIASLPLNQASIDRTVRHLTNPDIRVPLRADLPPVLDVRKAAWLPLITAELEKCGETLATVGEINLFCPQKDPDIFLGHKDNAIQAFRLAAKNLKVEVAACGLGPQSPKILTQDAICERVHLDRSHNIDLIHSITQRQIYGVSDARVNRPARGFLSAASRTKPHYSIIFDWTISSGTTLANLSSYVTYNGGYVLALASQSGKESLQPQFKKLIAELNLGSTYSKKKNIPALIGCLLAETANFYQLRPGITAKEAFDICEKALNTRGHSFFALTHEEAYRVIDGLRLGALDIDNFSAAKFPPVFATPLRTAGVK